MKKGMRVYSRAVLLPARHFWMPWHWILRWAVPLIRYFICWLWLTKLERILRWTTLTCSPARPPAYARWLPIPKSIMYKTLTVPVASLPSWMSLPRADWSIRMSAVWMEWRWQRQSTGIVLPALMYVKRQSRNTPVRQPESSIWYSAHKMRLIRNSIRTVRPVVSVIWNMHTARMAVWRFWKEI